MESIGNHLFDVLLGSRNVLTVDHPGPVPNRIPPEPHGIDAATCGGQTPQVVVVFTKAEIFKVKKDPLLIDFGG